MDARHRPAPSTDKESPIKILQHVSSEIREWEQAVTTVVLRIRQVGVLIDRLGPALDDLSELLDAAKQIAETAEGLAVSAKGIDQSAEIIARDAEKIAHALPAVERLGRLADRLPGGGRRSAAGR
ncbi:hypothetical protein P3H15_29305 [Rhodococcus sp. T2V]|uniref:hypothetical protein n=1 Tax=Rhodococcus sp. T2V TaxID=3034164 RepID=UPI0023E24931|nr:hypothetical protein [Rhodococcus sp. T2V]MDF3309112.1 hypothetical protein [Rhodococcus sp. T2V]